MRYEKISRDELGMTFDDLFEWFLAHHPFLYLTRRADEVFDVGCGRITIKIKNWSSIMIHGRGWHLRFSRRTETGVAHYLPIAYSGDRSAMEQDLVCFKLKFGF